MSAVPTNSRIDPLSRIPQRDPSFATEKARLQNWDDLIKSKLVSWQQSPGQFDSDEIDSPTPPALDAAIAISKRLRMDRKPPEWVVPTGDGGVAMRWEVARDELVTLEFDEAGHAWRIQVEHGHITSRTAFRP